MEWIHDLLAWCKTNPFEAVLLLILFFVATQISLGVKVLGHTLQTLLKINDRLEFINNKIDSLTEISASTKNNTQFTSDVIWDISKKLGAGKISLDNLSMTQISQTMVDIEESGAGMNSNRKALQAQLAKNTERLNHLRSLQKPGVIISNAEAVTNEIQDLEQAISILQEHLGEGTNKNP